MKSKIMVIFAFFLLMTGCNSAKTIEEKTNEFVFQDNCGYRMDLDHQLVIHRQEKEFIFKIDYENDDLVIQEFAYKNTGIADESTSYRVAYPEKIDITEDITEENKQEIELLKKDFTEALNEQGITWEELDEIAICLRSHMIAGDEIEEIFKKYN